MSTFASGGAQLTPNYPIDRYRLAPSMEVIPVNTRFAQVGFHSLPDACYKELLATPRRF